MDGSDEMEGLEQQLSEQNIIDNVGILEHPKGKLPEKNELDFIKMTFIFKGFYLRQCEKT